MDNYVRIGLWDVASTEGHYALVSLGDVPSLTLPGTLQQDRVSHFTEGRMGWGPERANWAPKSAQQGSEPRSARPLHRPSLCPG